MAVLPILRYPNPALRIPSKPVGLIDGALPEDVAQLGQDLIDTLYHCQGAVGLAAPQLGVHLRVVVVDVTAKGSREALKVLINPEVVASSRNKLSREGCLSFPEYLANIRRPTKVTIRALNLKGEEVLFDARKLEATAILHEIDHLDGVLLIDRVASLKTDLIRRRGRSVAGEGEHGGPEAGVGGAGEGS